MRFKQLGSYEWYIINRDDITNQQEIEIEDNSDSEIDEETSDSDPNQVEIISEVDFEQ